MDLGTLQVDKVIVHEVPERLVRGSSSGPVLSEIESPLNVELRNYLREKIIGSLITGAYAVFFDPNSTSPVPALTQDNLGRQKTDFVPMSQKMAKHLYSCQTGVNPSGLLVVAQTSLRRKRSLVILKLEKEAGARVQQGKHHGKFTFNIEHIKELVLHDRTRVFKASLFLQNGTTLASIEGTVSDNQRGYLPSTEVADFFLKKFLGCVLLEAADVTTKHFFEATQGFINLEVADASVKARYQIALLAEMTRKVGTVEIRGFAENHLDVDDRQAYVAFLRDSGFQAQQFDKDISLVEARIKKMQFDFESGLAVIGPPESFDQHVKMKDLEDGRTRVEIEDKLKTVRTRGRKGGRKPPNDRPRGAKN